MRHQTNNLIQSKFYSPAFNGAIFDGPIRIYFAQYQESQALKIYFGLQRRFETELADRKANFKRMGTNIFIMLYPSAEVFENSFSNCKPRDFLIMERLDEDMVFGIRGPIAEDNFEEICNQMEISVKAQPVRDKIPFAREILA